MRSYSLFSRLSWILFRAYSDSFQINYQLQGTRLERNKIEFGVCESNSQKNLGANCSKSQIYARQSTSFTYSDDSNRFCNSHPSTAWFAATTPRAPTGPRCRNWAWISNWNIVSKAQKNRGIAFFSNKVSKFHKQSQFDSTAEAEASTSFEALVKLQLGMVWQGHLSPILPLVS